MIAFTTLKIWTLNIQWLLTALLFGAGAAYVYVRSKSGGEFYSWQVILCAGSAVLLAAFPLAWTVFPNRHPVRRALAAHGDADRIASRLDAEMKQPHMVLDPFHFTASFLVYSPSYALDVVAYDCIASARWELDHSGEPPATPKVIVETRDGKSYTWHRTWIQGRFDAAVVVEAIQARARFSAQSPDRGPP